MEHREHLDRAKKFLWHLAYRFRLQQNYKITQFIVFVKGGWG